MAIVSNIQNTILFTVYTNINTPHGYLLWVLQISIPKTYWNALFWVHLWSQFHQIDGLAQDCSNALELLLHCTKPSISFLHFQASAIISKVDLAVTVPVVGRAHSVVIESTTALMYVAEIMASVKINLIPTVATAITPALSAIIAPWISMNAPLMAGPVEIQRHVRISWGRSLVCVLMVTLVSELGIKLRSWCGVVLLVPSHP